MTNKQAFDKSVAFIQSIGIEVKFEKISVQTILPGLSIQNGSLVVDLETLQYPGDILHEAGHIAVVPAADRSALTEKAIGERADYKAEEMMAISWSYAACRHLDLDPEFVFHEDGYRGGSDWIMETLESGSVFGLPLFEWLGMSLDKKKAASQGKQPFPVMQKWMRE